MERRVGRPPKFETPDDLVAAMDAYFAEAKTGELTVTGLALAVGLSRQGLNEYEAKDGFSEIVRRAKSFIEQDYELSLRKHGRSGDIFALKNFGWKDAQDHNIGGQADNPLKLNFNGVPGASR